ncbi:MAG: hypothetical protein M9918_25365 [Anaerolineae bacterium]|nr:hypothetical protein [Anaerolineae bacterium]
MSDVVITYVDQVSAEWLTAVLTASGALTRGSVVHVKADSGGGNWSENARLHLHYSEDAQGDLPVDLFLKLVDTDTGDGEFFGPSEVTYYTRDYVTVPEAPLLRCYDSAYSEEQRRYHLLLDDVSATHVRALDVKPTPAFGLALAEGLAVMHARWWGAERLQEAGESLHSADFIRRFATIAAPGVTPQLTLVADQLPAGSAELLADIFRHHPQQMVARTTDPNGFTIIHGDANALNILVPRVGTQPIYIIDRQPFDWSLTIWLGVYDLAYLMVLWWESDVRHALEEPVLRHYHAHLRTNGITDYSWSQLWDDYRLAVVQCVYVATEWCRGGNVANCAKHQWIWFPKLLQALTACNELRCSELWRR